MDLALSVKQLFDFAGDDPNRPFRPVIEKDFGQQRYLTEDPTMSFQLCQFEKVPVLAGVTRYEKLSHALGEYMLMLQCLNFTQMYFCSRYSESSIFATIE